MGQKRGPQWGIGGFLKFPFLTILGGPCYIYWGGGTQNDGGGGHNIVGGEPKEGGDPQKKRPPGGEKNCGPQEEGRETSLYNNKRGQLGLLFLFLFVF